MKGWSVSEWLDILKSLRTQYHEIAQHRTGPRVCWFRISFPQPIVFQEAARTVETLLPHLPHLKYNANGAGFLIQQGDQLRRWWCAILDCAPDDLSLFTQLADQSYGAVHWGLHESIGNVADILKDWPTGNYASATESNYIYWITAAANIRRFRPEPMLAVTQFSGGRNLNGEDCEPKGRPGVEFAYDIPIEQVGEYTNGDDGIVLPELGNSPFVQGCITKHDVWRFSVAALDHIISAAEKAPPKVIRPTTANDARDKWLYNQCCMLVKYETIKSRLSLKKKWEPIESIQGIKLAANRYAKANNLPLIPSRQPGREQKKK